MGVIGLAVLYAAFALVALWLLGELLLQHRAGPHWRVLALVGFLALVAGVAQGSLPLIGGGVVAFGAGQYLVTRSVKTGAGPYWSLRSRDGSLPGPLAGVPLLASVFPAGEAVPGGEGDEQAQGVRVGEVGPVEEAPPTIAYDPASFEEEAAGEEYPRQQPFPGYAEGQYAESQYTESQYTQEQYGQPQYTEYPQQDYGYQYQEYAQPAYAQAPAEPQVQYDANGFPVYPSEQQQYAPQGDYSYGYEQQQYQQQAYDPSAYQYGYQPEQQQPAEQPQQPNHEVWQQQYG
ncbi:hypothetical protein [Streptacidiphilus sp. EB103A]|uniref:hypothetical protein n=1 Tax=Streptacidiphilus sp. EB103A TaxID=3156275 RepID=UPI003517ADDD